MRRLFTPHKNVLSSTLPFPPVHNVFYPSSSSSLCFLNFHTGVFKSSVMSTIKPTYFLTQTSCQIIPPSVLSHLYRRPTIPLFILSTIPSHLLCCPKVKRSPLTSSSFSSLSFTSSSPRSAVPRSASNLENTEKKRVRTRLKKLILKRPPLQALQEKGLIKGMFAVDTVWRQLYLTKSGFFSP